jgi:hypothetical protein
MKKRHKFMKRDLDVENLRFLIDHDILGDVLLPQDVGLVKSFVTDTEHETKTKERARNKVREHVEDVWKQLGRPRGGSSGRGNYRHKQVGWKSDIRLAANTKDKISLLKPPGGTISISGRGQFVVIYELEYIISYSWTVIRTPTEALRLALNTAWKMHEATGDGAKCPKEVQEEIDRVKTDIV